METECELQGGGQLLRLRDADALAAHRLGHLGEINIAKAP